MPNPPGNSAKPDCCGGSHRVSYENGRRQEIVEEDMPEVDITYSGNKAGSFSVYGTVSKRQYRFSSLKRTQPVDERDTPGILSTYRDFTAAGLKPLVQSRQSGRTQVNNAEGADAKTEVESPPVKTTAELAAERAATGRPPGRTTPFIPKRASKVEDRGTTKVDFGPGAR